MEDNVLFIGKKSISKYAFSLKIMSNQFKKVSIKARGKYITKAVNVSQYALNFLEDWEVKKVNVGTEKIEKTPVSFIEIDMGGR